MQRMIDEQSREIEEMNGDFQQATQLMNEKYNGLNEKFIEL